jgi:hypothetical protein
MSDGRQHTPHVFTSTGVECTIKHVSNIKVSEAIAVVPKPVPPLTEVKNADGTVRQEPNRSHPDYLQAEAEYRMDMERLLRLVYVKFGVEYELTDKDIRDVAQFRAEVKATSGRDMVGDDKTIFITFFAIGDDQDYQDFVSVCQGRSLATDPKSTLGTNIST